MGDSAKPIQMHKAGVPSSASPLRDRPSFVIPSPVPAAPGDLKPPDWDGWIERARLLGHNLENLNAPENGIRQPSVQRFVRPTLKVDRAPGVVQFGKGKIKKKPASSTAKKSDSGVKVESAPKKDEPKAPAAGSEAKKVTAPQATGGTKQQRRAAKKAAEATKKDSAAPAGGLPAGARSSVPPRAAPTKVGSKATTSSAAADAAAAAAAAAAGATSPGAKAVDKVNEKSTASNSSTASSSAARAAREKKASAADSTGKAPVKKAEADDEEEESAEAQMQAARKQFLKAFPGQGAVFDSSPDRFQGIQYEDIKDIQTAYGNRVAGLADQMEKMPVPDSGVGGSGDWAAGAIRREAVATAEGDKDLYSKGKYTLHHKVAQSKLKKLLAAMEKDEKAARPMAALIRQIGGDLGAESEEKILMSMPGNLEIGPDAELRTDDPGEGFDPNYESGKRTPRSEILHDVDQKLSGKFDFNYIASKLSEVHTMTKKKTQGKRHMTPPLKKQWKKDKDDKFSRS